MTSNTIKVACFGGSNLTKGLLYPLFIDSGYDVSIVTLTDRSLLALRDGYVLEEIGDSAKRREYTGIKLVKLVDLSDDELASFQIMTTAVGSANIPVLASALRGKRLHPELQILLCENDIECFRTLHAAVPRVLATIVDRIVYSTSVSHVFAEKYFSVEVFQRKHRQLPPFVTISKIFEQSFFKKRYLVNTMHAIIAWAGHAQGYSRINEALGDKKVSALAREVADELLAILEHKFPLAPARAFSAFAKNALQRFSDKNLDDPIQRVGRNALAKLGKGERVLEPLCYACAHGFKHSALLHGAAYGVLFNATGESTMQAKDESIFSYIEMSEGRL